MLLFALTTVLASCNSSDVLPLDRSSLAGEALTCASPGSEVRNGARAQFDPLGRGVWWLDDENDEVVLVPVEAASRAPVCVQDASLPRFSPGRWPEQLVVSPEGRVFVTARESGQLFIIEPDFTTRTIPLAPEPRSLALDVTGHRLYVGLVTASEVVALDSDTGAVLQRRSLDASPDFLALTPAGLLVASRRSDVVSVWGPSLEPRGARVLEVTGALGARVQGLTSVFLPPPARREVRGVVGLTAEGARVTMVVARAVTETSQGLFGLFGTGGFGVRGRAGGGGGYGGGGTLPVSHELFAGVADASGVAWLSSAQLLPSDVPRELVMAGGHTWVVSEAGEVVQHFDERLLPESRFPGARTQVSALAAEPDQSWVLITREREVQHFAVRPPTPDGVRGAGVFGPPRPVGEPSLARTVLPPSRLDAQLRRGRALFHLADARISRLGLACVSCHPEGREDGRVWTQAGTLRQTPMLAERLADTAPYNWQGTSRTLDENIHQTITERLEGDGLSKADTAALRRYLLEGLRPVKTRPTPAEALVARGAELFADEEVGCAHCHPAERGFTDGKGHDVKFVTERERERFQLETGARRVPKKFDTPSLRHLKVTAPYLHNGEAATLAMLLEVNHDRMGATSQLSPDEREALVAYLESL